RVGHDGLEAALAATGVQGAVVGDDRTILAAYTSGQPVCEVRRLLVEASGLPAAHVRALTLDALPRLPTGKIDYETLRGELLRPAEQAAGDVATLFRETFFPQAVGDGDTFVGLGGDSLRHVQVSIGLERALGHIPDGWETMPVRRLAGLRPKETAGRGCEIGSDLVIRTLAALLVVVHHATLWPIPGGAAALMMLVGYSLARFQYDALVEGRFSRVLRPVGSLLVPYAALVVGFSVAWQQVPWASVFLVGNLGFADPDHHTMLPLAYWFVEAFVQLTLLWIGVMAIPPVRRFARRDPFGFGLGFLAAALAVRLAQPLVWDIDWRRIFTLHWNLYLAAFGWCAVFAVSLRQKLLLLAAAVVVMPLMAYTGGNWTSSWVKFLLQIPVLSVLLFAPRMRLPRRLFALIVPFGVASYHIYLFHGLAPDLLRAAFGQDIAGPHVTVAVIATGVALGLVAHRVQEQLLRALARLRAARRPVAGPSFAPAE
ncbi:MAG: hypothetical protein LDL26_05095, partial [Caenispirillum bisanense]|nr:hypothetical protein [Caenispirillum bisanense]